MKIFTYEKNLSCPKQSLSLLGLLVGLMMGNQQSAIDVCIEMPLGLHFSDNLKALFGTLWHLLLTQRAYYIYYSLNQGVTSN